MFKIVFPIGHLSAEFHFHVLFVQHVYFLPLYWTPSFILNRLKNTNLYFNRPVFVFVLIIFLFMLKCFIWKSFDSDHSNSIDIRSLTSIQLYSTKEGINSSKCDFPHQGVKNKYALLGFSCGASGCPVVFPRWISFRSLLMFFLFNIKREDPHNEWSSISE